MLAELRQISKHYGPEVNRNEVLREISLAIGEGDSLAIVGPSGAGKSTLLNILGTLDTPSSGAVLIGDQDIRGMKDFQMAEIRSRTLGFVFQLHYLLPQLTLEENVFLPLNTVRDRTARRKSETWGRWLLDRFGLHDQVFRRPAELSLGECQRAAVVRALINKPRLVLADEPTGSLDAANASSLGSLLAEINRQDGIALAVVTHSMELAAKMQRAYRLQEGKLTGITTG